MPAPIFVNISTAQSVYVWMFDSTDGKTEKTSLTLAPFLVKEGESSFTSVSPTVTEIGSGCYRLATTTTHNNTSGLESIRATATGADAANVPNVIDVIAMDKTSTTRGFSGTALPAVAAAASGGLPTFGTGTGQLNVAGGRADADVKYFGGTIAATPSVAGIPKAEGSGGTIAAVSGAVGSVTGAVGSVTGAVGSVTGAVGSVTGAVGSVTGNVGGNVVGTVASVVGAVGSVTGNVGGNVVGTVASVVGAVGSVTALAANAITAAATATDFGTEVAAAIWGATAEGANTYAGIVRLLTGILGGTVLDFTTDTLVFKSLDGTKTRATIILDTAGGTGRLSITIGDLS